MNFTDVFKKVVSYFTPGLQDAELAESLKAFKEFLNGKKNEEIRIWVSNAPAEGFQSNTIDLLYQLTNGADDNGFEYAGTINVYYKDNDDETMLKTLFRLLPSLKNQATGGKVNKATVNLNAVTKDSKPPSTAVNLGFTGAEQQADDKSSPKLAKQLNTNYLLRLEPYLSTLPEEVQFSSMVKPNINLAKLDLLAKGSFKQRAYWTQVPVPEPDWAYYEKDYPEQVGIIKSLLGKTAVYDITLTYGIRTSGDYLLQSPPEERMFEAIAGYMASQMQNATKIRTGAKPIVVLSLNDFKNRTSGSEVTVDTLLKGGLTVLENAWSTELNPSNIKKPRSKSSTVITENRRNQLLQNLKPSAYRKAYLEKVNPGMKDAKKTRVNLLWDATKAKVEQAYSFLNGANNKILLVQLGRLPQPLFDYLMYKATLPPVFEGADTANLALQTGKPYLNVSKANSAVVQYPTTLLGYSDSKEYENYDDTTAPFVYVPNIVYQMQDIANKINFSLEEWPNGMADTPAEAIGTFIRDYLETSDSEFHTYYKDMEEFYQDVANDKFRVGLSYFAYILQSTGAIKPVEEDPLGKLLAKLYENFDDKTKELKLLPGVYGSGAIYNFISGLVGTKLTLTDAVITPGKDAKDVKEIIVKGNSSVISGVPLAFNIQFTAPEGSVVSNWKLTYTGDWITTEMPWLLFDLPYVMFTVADTTMPVQGGVGGILRGLDLDLSIRLPIQPKVWQLEGHFKEPASISKFYQMAGGVNLVQALPSPFNAFSAIGVTDCQMAYNSKTNNVEYVSFVMATKETVPLKTGLIMDSITFNVLVQNPGSVAKRNTTWSVMGKFKIGTTDPGVVMLGMSYPGPVLTGQLADGVIQVSDLFNLFLPGTVFSPSSGLPVVTEFESSFDGTSGDYSVVSKLNFDWTFPMIDGARAITINQVCVNVQSANKEIKGGISGGFTFGMAEDKTILSITVSADYSTAKGWAFKGKQDTDTLLNLSDLINFFLPKKWQQDIKGYSLKNLYFNFEQKSGYYEIGGETAGYWEVPFIALKVRADLKFGYGVYKTDSGKKDGSKLTVIQDGKVLTLNEGKVGYYCTLNADIEWIGIKMRLFYDYNPDVKKYGFTWGVLTGSISEESVKGDDKKHWIGRLSFTDSVTLGSMIEEAISWCIGYKYGLSAPFNLLNSLSLSALKLEYDFTAKTVSFSLDIGEINLGFCVINKIGISYQSGQEDKTKNGVFITIEGKFFWITEPTDGQTSDKLNWDASKPETTPSPSGQGNKYFDLRLLAIGQHVTVPGFANTTSVKDAIAAMAKLPDTDVGEIPGITFDPNSSWLVGMDFGVLKLEKDKKDDKKKALLASKDGDDEGDSGYFIDMQIVFNDPNLYALRIALSGAPARIFKGLDFQILYRKISDSVGVYMAEIALPDVMRKIQLGQVNITLPVFAIEIYTNGDFLVDLGFPKNADFSRSFTLQMIIYVPIPIPIMGSAGLYFGKKSSATSTEVPVIDNGTFNPVLVFGVGIQFGLGYDFNAGILAAGFSLTFVTIIEGVLAKFNPYQPQNISTGQQADIAPAYYYSIKGVVGIQGKLYGYVDFKIIKAEVNILLSVLADITITSYAPILLGLTASVKVSVSIKINLGFFSITISFSFGMTIRASYEIKAGGGKAPWNVVSGPKTGSRTLLHNNQNNLSAKLRAASFLAALQDNYSDTPVWANLNAATVKAKLTGYIGFGLSMAGDTAAALNQQQAVYTAMLFIDSVASSNEATNASDTSFEILSKQVFRWVIAAFHKGAIGAADVDNLAISKVRLDEIYAYLNNASNTDPIPVKAIDDFLGGQVTMTFSHPADNKGTANAAYFPVAPKLSMTLPAMDMMEPLTYSFDKYNALSDSYIDDLRKYFDELAVQLQQNQHDSLLRDAAVKNDPESLATFIYADYFLLIARQMVHNAQNALSAFQYHMIQGQTPEDIVKWINKTGQFNGGYTFKVNDLFEENKSHVLTTGKTINVGQAKYSTISGDTFTSISQKAVYNGGIHAAALATLNAANAMILQSGAVVTYPGKPNVIVQAGNSLESLAAVGFEVPLSDFLSKSNVLQLEGLIMPSSALQLPGFGALTQEGDTLTSFSARFGVNIDMLAKAAGNNDIVDLFNITENNGKLIISDLPQFRVGALIDEIQSEKGLQQLSGMASRYYLTGLRLPTNGITPKYRGMWVNGKMQYDEETAGLFSLTGQQFPLPVLQSGGTFNVSFNIPAALPWMIFAGDKQRLDIPVKADSVTYSQIAVVRDYALANYIDLGIEQLGPGDMFNSSYVHYAFSNVCNWQAGSSIILPYGGVQTDAQALSIWTLPGDLINLADPAGRAVTPRFQVQIGAVDPETKSIRSKPITDYGWGTQINFTVKKVPLSPDSPASANTYEISGADGNNALMLEKMVTGLGTNDGLINLIAFGFAPNQSNGVNPGIQTDPIASLTIGIAQANLSTFTRPAPAANRLLAIPGAQSNLLNKPTELIRLLWQASITRDGGYYLYYFNAEDGEGLPDHAFNDKGEAILSLITVYNAPGDVQRQDLLVPYLNMFVTGTPVNVNNSSIYAQAAPIVQQAAFGKDDTLNNIAYRYFTNIGDVVVDNPNALLTTGIGISVAEGTYQVRNAQGETLQSVADTFGTNVTDIQKANPLVTSWPAILPMYTGLRLPPLTVAAGGAHSKTLPVIANYYGMDLTALANYNGDVPNLFVTGTKLTMAGGPITRQATVPAGVVSLEAIRKEPAAIPADPKAQGYALTFLQNNFSILAFKLTANSWFKASKPSLPAGPTDSNTNVHNQVDKAINLDGKWVFKQSVPYYKFANQPNILAANGLPDITTSPYKGIGYLVQPDFMWLDIYGNKVLTNLSQPSGANGIFNEAPILTGYTDALLGVSQWPSVSAAWQVASQGNNPVIQVPLSFDTTPYNGLLSARAMSSSTILLTFTDAVDTTTASAIVNYKLDNNIEVQAAVVQSDAKTVMLTVTAMNEETVYTLSIGNIRNSAKNATYNGQATFGYPDVPAESSSSIVQQAQHDFQVYTQLWYQLTDPNGMAMSMKTSLFDTAFPVAAADLQDLVTNWIASIYLYLQDRSQSYTNVAAPVATYTLSFNIDPVKVHDAQIFELITSLSIERTGGAVMGDFETTGSVKKVTTVLSAATSSAKGATKGLNEFADSFETVMSIADTYYLKIATGADRDKLGQQKPDGTIWAVRLGVDHSKPISYDIAPPKVPKLFAPKPVSNKLESRSGVPIYNYSSETGIDFNNPSFYSSFTEVDLDQWVGMFFNSMDTILTPEFTASIQLVDKKLGKGYLKSIQTNKEALADIAKLLMVAVFADETANASAVQEALKQALLVKLMNLYATNSGIAYDVNVNADPVKGAAPNLFGNFLQNTIFEGAVADAGKLKQVTLHFSAPLDAKTAVSPSNYTLEPVTAITSVAIADDEKSVLLNTADNVVIGTTKVTIGDALLDSNNRKVEGVKTYTVAKDYVSYAKTDQLTISSAKIKVDQSSTQSLAFLLSSPEIVRSQSGEVLSKINLNLSYKATDIEHQIAAPINGFTPSSWLSFVLPDLRTASLESQLGGFSVPMFLRSFPANPALVNQNSVIPNIASKDISKLMIWNYIFDYEQNFHYPQDTLHFTVNFNVGDAKARMLKALPDAFNQLAEFVVVYPSIQVDLKAVVTRIDAKAFNATGPDAEKLFQQANTALQSFTQVVQRIVDAAKTGGLRGALPPGDYVSNGIEPYSFEIQEGPKSLDGKQVQVVSIKGKPPVGVGKPQVLIEPDVYTMTPWTNTEDPCGGDICYYYVDKKGVPLLSETAQNISSRQVVLPDLNILQRQDAMTTVFLKRNEDLIPGRKINPDFVYTTGKLGFSNAYLPGIVSDQFVEIANLPDNTGMPVSRTLFAQLKTLMSVLLKDNKEPSLRFQMTCSYDYKINPTVNLITMSIPVLMQTMVNILLKDELDPMLQSWADSINQWFDMNKPNPNSGAYKFDLVIFSNLTKQPFPLIRLTDLTLSLKYILPS